MWRFFQLSSEPQILGPVVLPPDASASIFETCAPCVGAMFALGVMLVLIAGLVLLQLGLGISFGPFELTSSPAPFSRDQGSD